MGLRQRQWATRKRIELIDRLGGKCAKCGSIDGLEFDHKDGREWSTKREQSWRISIFTKEIESGLIQLLCRRCNAQKGILVERDGQMTSAEFMALGF